METVNSAKELLNQAIEDLKAKNPQLSLRAIAKRLSTAPSYVSEVLNGKKLLSVSMAARIAERLKFTKEQADLFITLAELEGSKDDALRSRLTAQITGLRKRVSIKRINVGEFSPISDWYYFAILELTRLKDFSLTPQAIALHLGVTTEMAEGAIEKLLVSGLLTKNEDGSLAKSDARITFNSENRNDDLRKFHKQFLAKATQSLETQSNKEKFVGSETFAFDSNQLSAANQIIEDCFSRLVLLASQSETKDSVYHAGIQMFRLTKGPNS